MASNLVIAAAQPCRVRRLGIRCLGPKVPDRRGRPAVARRGAPNEGRSMPDCLDRRGEG
jgi:hypothetical protein